MATLDRVIGLQQQGLSDADISTQLQNEGIAPSEINNSINQAKIKQAVSPTEAQPQGAQPQGAPGMPDMQVSIMAAPGEQSASPEQEGQAAPGEAAPPMPSPTAPAPPGPEVYPPQDQAPAPDAYPPAGSPEAPQDDYYTQTPQAYGQDYYAPQGGVDTETISEIAEQVATEKLNEYKKKTGDIVSFKNTIQDKVNDIDDRLKRIEATIDKLQQAIIGKIGEFGESNAMIHKDLDNLHGTVSKLMNPLMDNLEEMKKIAK